MEIATIEYSEWQNSENLLAALRRLKPGTVAFVEVPKPGGSVSLKLLVLSTRIRWGKKRTLAGLPPSRTVTGLVLQKTFLAQDIEIEADPVGHQAVRLTVSLSDPDPTDRVYVRYREHGTAVWSTLSSKPQDEEVIFSASGLKAETLYTAQASLASNFTQPAQVIFETGVAPGVAEFFPLHKDNTDPQDIIRVDASSSDNTDRFCVLDGTRKSFFVYDENFAYVEEFSLPATFYRAGDDISRAIDKYHDVTNLRWARVSIQFIVSYTLNGATHKAACVANPIGSTLTDLKAINLLDAFDLGRRYPLLVSGNIGNDQLSVYLSARYKYRDIDGWVAHSPTRDEMFVLGLPTPTPNSNDAASKEDALPVPTGVSRGSYTTNRVDAVSQVPSPDLSNLDALFTFPPNIVQQATGIAGFDAEIPEGSTSPLPTKFAIVDHAARQIIPFNIDGSIVGGVTGSASAASVSHPCQRC